MTFPQQFIEQTKALLLDEYNAFENALSETPPTSIRVNNKMDYRPDGDPVTWCEKAYYLPERPLFTADPLFHAGVYYVQEASSMFLSQVVSQYLQDSQTVLDLCAAPGGKSTLLLQFLPQDCLLVSNEMNRQRSYILAENIAKWGNPNVMVTNNNADDFSTMKGFFDAIVVDAPCSGEGMFRKDKQAIAEWSEQNVEICAERQRKILADAWDALKPNGILVYSTCTYNRKENEENVEWLCDEYDAETLSVNLNGNTDIVVTDYGYRFFQHRTKGEGFFLSVIRKNENTGSVRKLKADFKKGIKFVDANDIPFKLSGEYAFKFVNDENHIRAYIEQHFERFMYLNSKLKCIDSGLLVAEIKGKDYIPSAQLALSKSLDTGSVERAELDYNTAISYLKRESIELYGSAIGFVLVQYMQQSLGWVKNIGTRSNNLYPTNWRIRMNL